MTIVSHTYGFIYLRTVKTASTAVEVALSQFIGPRDLIQLTPAIQRINHPFLRTRTQTTGLPRLERFVKNQLGHTRCVPGLRLQTHCYARRVREVVGEDVWNNYVKFTVERNPWDRFISLWRWMTKDAPHVTIDDYLAAIESGDPERLRQGRVPKRWSNWPIYAIDDQIVADIVIQYDRLAEGLHGALGQLGIPWDGRLPWLKAARDGRPEVLTAEHVERIGRIYRREVDAFGYEPPMARAGQGALDG